MTLSSVLKSMRLRTLPLSLSGTVIGIGLSFGFMTPGVWTIVFLVLTTASLQILSNLSNELGDTLHGTDTDARQGIHYSIQDGEMTVSQMKNLIRYVAVATLISGLLMIRFSFGTLFALEPAVFVLLGAAAIWAAMHYTLGDNPYGYRGLGDIFVFIFFGLVSTVGSFYICSHCIDLLKALLPACGIGFFSVGVLNVNNIRDMKSDAATRTTVALKLGLRRARIYHVILISAGWACMLLHTAFHASLWASWLYLITLPLYVLHVKGVCTRSERALDPMLPLLVLSTFALSLLFIL